MFRNRSSLLLQSCRKDPSARLRRFRNLVLIVLFADLTAVAAKITIPLPPVPLTLQTAAVLLSGAVLGSGAGAASQALYLAMGLVGLPVFAAGGGLSYVLSPTFGYLAGFVGGAWLTGRLLEIRQAERFRGFFMAMMAGLVVIYSAGLVFLYLNLRFIQLKDVPVSMVIQTGLLLPLPGDLLKIGLAAAVAVAVKGRVPALFACAGRGD